MKQASINQILRQLDPETLRQIEPSLQRVELKQGEILGEPFGRMQSVYFPLTAVVSAVVELFEGHMTEAAMIGRDGVVGAGEAITETSAFNRIVVQVPGIALMLSANRFRELHSAHEPLQQVIGRYRQFYLAQSQQAAACNANHHIDARLCRWLLRVRDLAGDEFSLTQEFIAEMLDVRRPSLSVVASKLRDAGLISYVRGHIKIKDPARLQDAACECFARIKQYEEAGDERRNGAEFSSWSDPGP